MGLDVHIGFDIEAPDSKVDPDHMFKLDYWRSSYNRGGFNNVVASAVGEDLYTITGITWEQAEDGWKFDPNDPEELETEAVYVGPVIDWAKARDKALEVAARLREEEAFGVEFHAKNPFATDHAFPKDEDEALAIFRRTYEDHRDTTFGGSFSNLDGLFHLETPQEIVAIIPGTGFGGDGVYTVFRYQDIEWYAKAAEIVAETCDFALKHNGRIEVWSG